MADWRVLKLVDGMFVSEFEAAATRDFGQPKVVI